MRFIHYFDKCSLIIIIYGNVSQYANKHIAIFYEINESLGAKKCMLNLSQFLEKNINLPFSTFYITFSPEKSISYYLVLFSSFILFIIYVPYYEIKFLRIQLLYSTHTVHVMHKREFRYMFFRYTILGKQNDSKYRFVSLTKFKYTFRSLSRIYHTLRSLREIRICFYY